MKNSESKGASSTFFLKIHSDYKITKFIVETNYLCFKLTLFLVLGLHPRTSLDLAQFNIYQTKSRLEKAS